MDEDSTDKRRISHATQSYREKIISKLKSYVQKERYGNDIWELGFREEISQSERYRPQHVQEPEPRRYEPLLIIYPTLKRKY